MKLTVVGFKIMAMDRFNFPPSFGFRKEPAQVCLLSLSPVWWLITARLRTWKSLKERGSDLGTYTRLLAESSFSESFNFMLPMRSAVAETPFQMAPLASSGCLLSIWQPYSESMFSIPKTSSLHCSTGSLESFGWNRGNGTSH